MGCGSSAQPGKTAGGGTHGDKRLLEEYAVGNTLGEGAFGVVSNCTHRGTGQQYAVKMIDKVETPVHAITKEAEMLQRMDHPNIVKFHGVFYERCFVCIVMDKYDGGDLVEGLQRHLKDKGPIDCFDVINTAQQMGSSLSYLHDRLVIHRDIKGDNYLMDRQMVTDPECRIVLTDFGTAMNTKPGERLSSPVGTKIFWSPEFYDRDYGLKVDVWAVGVIMYGLVSGRFPFRDQNDIKSKEVKIPKRVHPVCEDFIKGMLEKSERARFDAQQVMCHPWMNDHGPKKEQGPAGAKDDDDPSGKGELREDMVNDGIKERRQELINRLNMEHDARGRTDAKKQKSSHYLQSSFKLPDKLTPNSMFQYEWWDPAKVQQTGLLDIQAQAKPQGESVSGASDLTVFKQMLQEHNINPDVFGEGKAKTLPQLAAEVQSGACRLMLDAAEHKTLVRVVDVVLFRLRSGDGPSGRLLIETEECFADGRKRDTVRLPGTKKEPHENSKQTAERILHDMLSMSVKDIEFDLHSIIRFEQETDSPSYPGVRTVYRKEIVEAVVKATDSSTLAAIGLPSFCSWSATGKDGLTKTFNWYTEDSCKNKKIKFSAEGEEVVSTLVRAPIGLSEEQLRTELTSAGIDVARYGQRGKTKTLKEFSAELIRGEATLVKGPTGSLLRVVDVVLLVIKNVQTGGFLVQVAHEKQDGHKTALNRLPGAKCRPDENQFLSARRILRRQLDIGDNAAQFVVDVQAVEEEKPTDFYPGLKTVYRKRVITAEVVG